LRRTTREKTKSLPHCAAGGTFPSAVLTVVPRVALFRQGFPVCAVVRGFWQWFRVCAMRGTFRQGFPVCAALRGFREWFRVCAECGIFSAGFSCMRRGPKLLAVVSCMRRAPRFSAGLSCMR
jgi:hypothetical protein